MAIKIWLDDQIDDPATPKRHPPPGWVGVKTVKDAIKAVLRAGGLENVSHMSLDHDLGDHTASGYVFARWLEKQHKLYKKPLPNINIHSANPVGRRNIARALGLKL